MVTPAFLKPGDTVAIVSTARRVTSEELEPACRLLSEWGLKVVLGSTIGAEDNQFAGGNALRATDFQKMLNDPEIKAIWCARGGYGSVRMVDLLDFNEFRRNPKWIIGYSDITVLHSHIHSFGIETLHAQMPLGIEKKTPETATSIKKVIFGESYAVSYPSEAMPNRLGRTKGQLVGGNLSVLYSLCGSPSALNTDGKILFIEDLDEYLYHVDRMLQNLKRNGMLDNLAGLVVGGMTQMQDNDIPFGKTPEEIVMAAVTEYDYPVCFGFPAGHIDDNQALVMGREVLLEIHENRVQITF